MVSACRQLGDPSRGGDPSLWADALHCLALADAQELADCRAELREVISAVEREGVMSALAVLQVTVGSPQAAP